MVRVLLFWMKDWMPENCVLLLIQCVIFSEDWQQCTDCVNIQSFRGRARRLLKNVYPWLNTSFETWLLICNIAYLFEQTPFYRPWLSWVGVDLRRLGMDDFVRDLFILNIPSKPKCAACCSSGSWTPDFHRKSLWHPGNDPTSACRFPAIAFRLFTFSSADGDILRQVFRMVVLSGISCPFSFYITSRPSRASSAYTSSSSAGYTLR